MAAMLADGDDADKTAGKPKAQSKAKRTTKRLARKGRRMTENGDQERGADRPTRSTRPHRPSLCFA